MIFCIGAVSAVNDNDTINCDESVAVDENVDEPLGISDENEGLHNVEFEGKTFGELQKNIKSCNGGDIINLNNDIMQDGKSEILISKSLTVNGNGHTIDAQKKSRVFNITAEDVVLNNITFINGKYYDYGGAVTLDGVNCTIINCKFINNYGAYGGAVDLHADNARVINCQFVDNNGVSGAAVLLAGDNAAVINCRFINNTARYGGSIEVTGFNATIGNSLFINNTATSSGGAIYWFNSVKNGKIDNCQFTGNKAKYGGAVEMWSVNGIINNCQFTDNWASIKGGAVNLWGEWIIINSKFTNNAAYNGKSIYWQGSNGYIKNLTFDNSNVFSESDVYNKSKLFVDYGDFTSLEKLINSSSSNSLLTLYGDYAFNDTTDSFRHININLNNFTINANGHVIDAKGQNGIFTITGTDVSLNNMTFINANSTDYGGVIYWLGDNGTLSDVKFLNNSASHGGVICWQGNNGTIIRAVFINNTAEFGGVIEINSEDFTLVKTKFIDNATYLTKGVILYK